MMRNAIALVFVLAAIGCGDDPASGKNGVGPSGGDPNVGTGPDGGGGGGEGGGGGGDAGVPQGSSIGPTGNPNGACAAGVPARGQLADTSKPTKVIGNGSAASCTFAALQSAVTQGGIITFDCGPSVVTIPVMATMNLPTNKNTVIDGGGKIVLDGGDAVQILHFESANFRANDNGLTLQRIALVRGKKTPTVAIPAAPAPCSQGWNDGEGGALFMRDGYLNVVECLFTDNHAAPRGPDTGGGAIYVLGSKGGVVISKSTFRNNAASNAAAVGGLFAPLQIFDSLFTDNTALGDGANNDDKTKCSAINNGQNEVGSGGNGGAIYSDGASVDLSLCGDAITNNHAGTGAFGGGLFFTSNDFGGTLTIADTTMSGNTGGYWTNASTGAVTNLGTAVGTNCKSITLTNSKLQGLP